MIKQTYKQQAIINCNILCYYISLCSVKASHFRKLQLYY